MSQRPIPGTFPPQFYGVHFVVGELSKASRKTGTGVERAAPGFPIWPCTRWGFPCLVDYSSSGGLLPHLFTLTRFQNSWAVLSPKNSGTGRFIFCGTLRRDASRHRLPRVSPPHLSMELRGIAPCGVRTFLPRLAPGAIFRPSKIVWKVPLDPREHKASLAQPHYGRGIAEASALQLLVIRQGFNLEASLGRTARESSPRSYR